MSFLEEHEYKEQFKILLRNFISNSNQENWLNLAQKLEDTRSFTSYSPSCKAIRDIVIYSLLKYNKNLI